MVALSLDKPVEIHWNGKLIDGLIQPISNLVQVLLSSVSLRSDGVLVAAEEFMTKKTLPKFTYHGIF